MDPTLNATINGHLLCAATFVTNLIGWAGEPREERFVYGIAMALLSWGAAYVAETLMTLAGQGRLSRAATRRLWVAAYSVCVIATLCGALLFLAGAL